MPSTSVYALPYLAPTDPPDIAGFGEGLAEAVEDELVRIDAALAASRCVKRGERSTDFAPITTEAGVFRLDSIPITSGRRYAIVCNPTSAGSIVGGDEWAQRLRINQTGTATTGSTALCRAQAGNNHSVTLYAEFTAGSTGSACSVLLSVERAVGSGAATWTRSGIPFTLSIVDLGIAPGNTGVSL